MLICKKIYVQVEKMVESKSCSVGRKAWRQRKGLFDLSGVIGTNCRNLEVLDAEEDSEMTATDHGLAFLVEILLS